MRSQSFDEIATKVAELPVNAKIAGMWRLMRQLSRSSLSGAHAVLFLAIYGRVRSSPTVPTIDVAELALEVGVSCAALADLMADLADTALIMVDEKRGASARATIPSLLSDRSRRERRSEALELRVLH